MKTSSAEWLEAWATVAGAIFAAAAAVAAFLVLLHEIRIRRRDENDRHASVARLVFVTTGQPKGDWTTYDADREITSIELYMNNFSSLPIIDVAVSAERLDGGPQFNIWTAGLLGPGQSRARDWVFEPPLSWQWKLLDPPGLLRTKITFTDGNGCAGSESIGKNQSASSLRIRPRRLIMIAPSGSSVVSGYVRP